MKKTIHKLRQKDHEEKQRIAFIGAFFITAFIAMFWLMGITTTNNADETQVANVEKPFESIKNSFMEIFQK